MLLQCNHSDVKIRLLFILSSNKKKPAIKQGTKIKLEKKMHRFFSIFLSELNYYFNQKIHL